MCISAKNGMLVLYVTCYTYHILQYLGAMAAKKETTVQEHFNQTANWDILATVWDYFEQHIRRVSSSGRQNMIFSYPEKYSANIYSGDCADKCWRGVGGHLNLRLIEPTERRIQST